MRSHPPTLRAAGLLVALGLVATGCGSAVLDFTIGECVNLPDGELISEFESVGCDTAHDAEVFALPQFPGEEGTPFPGQAEIQAFADERCLAEFEEYVGSSYDTSELFATQLIPTAESWADAGDREVVCLLVGQPVEDGEGQVAEPGTYQQLTGGKRDSGE